MVEKTRFFSSVEVQRRTVFRHAKKDHDLGYKDEGTDHRRLYVDQDGQRQIAVGKSDEFQSEQSGVFCYTCDRYLADDNVIDEW